MLLLGLTFSVTAFLIGDSVRWSPFWESGTTKIGIIVPRTPIKKRRYRKPNHGTSTRPQITEVTWASQQLICEA